MSAWNRISTLGRRDPSSRRASCARCWTGSPSSGAGSGSSRAAVSTSIRNGTRSLGVSVAIETPLGLIHNTPSDVADEFPPPARVNLGSAPNSLDRSQMASNSPAGGVGAGWYSVISQDSMTVCLASLKDPVIRPTARAWTRALPMAVASLGPASMGRPV